MRLEVKVVPRAKKPGVEQMADGVWRVAVSVPADGGRANASVIGALAKQFDVPKRLVRILRGETARLKLIEIIDNG